MAGEHSTRGFNSDLPWRAFGVLLLVAYPGTVHYAPPAAAIALLTALASYIAASLLSPHPARWLVPPVAAAAAFVALPDARWLLFIPPVALNLALCWLFGRTLVRGRVPIIARFAMMEQSVLTPELAAYTRALTRVWTLLFAACAAASAGLALSGNRDAWSLFTNLLNYLLVAGLFLGEFAYRRLRYRGYRHQSPWKLARNIGRTNLFKG
jgi:uncharacterized membrane protein